MREKDVIQLFFPEGSSESSANLGAGADMLDDCAYVPLGKLPVATAGLLFTTDTMVEETHFRLEWSTARHLARKLFHVNLSDIVSSGGLPCYSLLNLVLPEKLPSQFLADFAAELLNEHKQFGCRLIGGDTVTGDKLMLSLTMVGQSERWIRRSGGRAGDHLYLTGTLGLSWAGLSMLKDGRAIPSPLGQAALDKHLGPRSRSDWAQYASSDFRIHAAIDISDSLAQDAERLAIASGLHISLDLDAIPVPAGFAEYFSILDAVKSGEELEILFLADRDAEFPFDCTRIGFAGQEKAPGVTFMQQGRAVEIADKGFIHFRGV